MRRSSLIHYVNAVCFLFLLSGCDDGWKNIGDDIQVKLFPMGDCSPNVREAQYLLVETRYHINKPPIIDSKGTYTIYSHNLKTEVILPWEDSIHWRIKNQLLAMNCGDAIHINCPLHAVNKTFLCAYQELPEERDEDYVEIQLNILKTFTEQGFHDYLISCAQHDEIPEVEAIELLLMNNTASRYEKHGDCFIQPIASGQGDTIGAGSEVTIAYTTFLLNGKPLDQPTDLQFTFGRPDQVVEGLQFALSKMRSGDEALVYLPSYLAFGEEGSTGGVVPPKTPVYFRVKVVDVKN